MAARARRGIEQNTIVLGTFGRLSAQKSLDTLIRAIPLIRQTVPARAIKVLIAGDGPLQAELEALASELGVSGMVTFEGFVENIPEFLDLLDVFVITSLWEGLSIALLEAMARACPIVATDIPPNAELIQDGVTGLLVPTHNPLAVAESVANLIQYPSKAQELGLSAQRIAKAKYGLDHMLDETWRLYVGALRHLKPSDPSRN
jgi:glycosyltransferase involved in cell wall biosynthesis